MKCLAKIPTFLAVSLIAISYFTTATAQSPLNVTSVFPTDGAVDVPVSVSPQVSFSFTLDPTTITSTSAFLTEASGNVVVAESRISSPDQVAIDPVGFLVPGTMYTIHITPDLEDVAGNSLAAEFTSQFTTATAQSPLNVTSVFPTDGAVDVPVSVSPQVSFSFTLDPTTITSASAFLTEASGNVVVAESRISSPDQVAIDPVGFLVPGTMYTIHITPDLEDVAGNSLAAEFTSQFTTATAQSPLNVTSVFPTDGAVDVPVSVSPQVSFSFTLDPTTITSASAFLTEASGNVVVAESRISSPDQVAIDPVGFLVPGTMYTIHITPDLEDVAGNSLAAEFTSQFTTAVPDTRGVETLSPAILWIGLKNSDDQNTSFDLKTEIYINDTLISDGIARCITGVTRNPNRAKQIGVPFRPITDNQVEAGNLLSFKVLTRIGTNPNDSKCAGHNNAVGLRLYYDTVNRPSHFGAEITPYQLTDLFLRSDGAKFLDDMAPTATTATFQDSSSLKFSGGNPWKEVGTWIMTIH